MNKRLNILIALAIGICVNAGAQVVTDSVLINFRQSKTAIDTAFMGNAEAFRHIGEMIERFQSPDSNYVITGIEVVGGASPEGSVRYNQWLSHQRADRIFNYVGQRMELPDSLTTFTFLGRDWQGLRQMVLADNNVPYRDDVLATLNDIIASDRTGETESMGHLNRIKRMHGGTPYLYMYRNIFPAIRASKIVLTYKTPHSPALLQRIVSLGIDDDIAIVAPEIPLEITPAKKPFYMSLNTNMLLDALLIPNIGAEFYLGKNLSVVGNWMYGWWDVDHSHWWWRAYGGDLGLRYWFGQKAHEKPLTGHHVGVYAGVVTYDFEWGGTGYMGGIPGRTLWDRCNWYCGAEYGYSLPITRRLNIDFTLGLGYMGGKYVVYDPVDRCYVYKETRKRRWAGPTKLEVSLVWLIGRGNVNKEKGGIR